METIKTSQTKMGKFIAEAEFNRFGVISIVLFSLFASISVSAQEVVSAQGESYSNASAKIDFTIGEVVINTGTDGTNELTQGFHQTNWNFVGLEDYAPDYQVTIFPNPTQDVLNIRTSTFENVTYTLYDAQGKLVLQNILSAEQTPIQVSQLAPGAYSLELIFEEGNKGSLSWTPQSIAEGSKRKTFKLVKSH